MLRKSVWGAIFAASALALALAIYTVVSLVGGTGTKKEKTTTEIAYALRVGGEFVVENGDMTFEGLDGELEKDQNGKYIATNKGDKAFKCTVVKKDKSKVVYTVTVYDFGSGILSDPYNITKASDLLDLEGNGVGSENAKTIYNKLNAVYALRSDIDLSELEGDWKPVGTYVSANESVTAYNKNNSAMFTGVFNGNGHTIKNMKINVNENNFADYYTINYVDSAYNVRLLVGFFGYTKNATIIDVVFDGAEVSVSENVLSFNFKGITDAMKTKTWALEEAGEKYIVINSDIFDVYAGIVAGQAVNTGIGKAENAVVVKNSSIVAANGNTLGGVATIAGETVNSTITNIEISNCSVSANALVANVGGIVGRVSYERAAVEDIVFENASETVKPTTISNVKIDTLNVLGDIDANSTTGGLVGLAYAAKISNVDAAKVVVGFTTKEYSATTTSSSYIAGAVAAAYSIKTQNGTDIFVELTNVGIDGKVVAIDAKKSTHDAAGFAVVFDGKMTDCWFAGEIEARVAAGLALYNYGEIKYTDGFSKKAVNATISGNVVAAGMVAFNYGGIISGGNAETKKVPVEVTLITKEYGTHLDLAAAFGIDKNSWEDAYVDNFAVAGVAAFDVGGTIKNISVKVSAQGPINFGGIAAFVGGSDNYNVSTYTFDNDNKGQLGQTKALNGGEVKNVAVDATVSTVRGAAYASTNRVGGAFALVESGADISKIDVVANINNYEDADTFGGSAYEAAGFAASVVGGKIKLDEISVKANIFVTNSARLAEGKYISYAAGFVAIIEQKGTTADDVIEISNISLVSDATYGKIVNMLGDAKYPNNSAEASDFDSANSGAFGLIASAIAEKASETSAEKGIVIENISISDYNVSAHFCAAKAFGSMRNVYVEGHDIKNITATSSDNNLVYDGVYMAQNSSVFEAKQNNA